MSTRSLIEEPGLVQAGCHQRLAAIFWVLELVDDRIGLRIGENADLENRS